MRDHLTDLLLGGSCVGCARPGRPLCPACAAVLPRRAEPAWPTPTPPGLAPPWATGAYDGLLRALVLGHKEHRLLALGPPLGGLLAVAARAATTAGPGAGPVVLVPVPSRPASVRARGHDPTYVLTRRAATLLGREGYAVHARRLLVSRPGVVDQAGLGAAERAVNLAGSMACPTRLLRRLARQVPRARVVVCDDVLTTGATAREAQRALEAVGLHVLGVAAVAATLRRGAGPGGPGGPGTEVPFLPTTE